METLAVSSLVKLSDTWTNKVLKNQKTSSGQIWWEMSLIENLPLVFDSNIAKDFFDRLIWRDTMKTFQRI